jgi:hypothetical protein
MVNIAKGAGDPGDTVGGAIFKKQLRTYAPSFPRREAPGLCRNFVPPKQRGRRQSRVSDAPVAPRAKVESTWVGTTGSPVQTGFPCAMVLTAYFVLSPVTGLSCHRRLADWRRVRPGWAQLTSAKLDASVGASGPHDFAVRNSIVRLRAGSPLTGPKDKPCDFHWRADAAASTASRPTSVTIASRPSCGRDGRTFRGDLPDGW